MTSKIYKWEYIFPQDTTRVSPSAIPIYIQKASEEFSESTNCSCWDFSIETTERQEEEGVSTVGEVGRETGTPSRGLEVKRQERQAFLPREYWWCEQGKTRFVLQLAKYWVYPLTQNVWNPLAKTIARIFSHLSFPQVWTKQYISLDLIWFKHYSVISALEISLILSRVRHPS